MSYHVGQIIEVVGWPVIGPDGEDLVPVSEVRIHELDDQGRIARAALVSTGYYGLPATLAVWRERYAAALERIRRGYEEESS